MVDKVASHYSDGRNLATAIADSLRKVGKDIGKLTTADLGTVDEFHIRGRKATLELGKLLNLDASSRVLDIGSGLGGPARTLAETYGCRVTGIDLTQEFCDAAASLSTWVGLADRVAFQQGDATNLPFADGQFDAAVTIHVAMNIAAKDRMYAEARRVLRPGGLFGVYDVLQGEGGDIQYPVPWARERSISHVATPDAMVALLSDAGFKILDTQDFLRGRPPLVRGHGGDDGPGNAAAGDLPHLPRRRLSRDVAQHAEQSARAAHPHGDLYLRGVRPRTVIVRVSEDKPPGGAPDRLAFGRPFGHNVPSIASGRSLSHGCGCSSGVEHNLAKVGVEGSNPFARSKEIMARARRRTGLFCNGPGQTRYATSIAPPAIIATPSQFGNDSCSPRKTTPNTATRTTLSLSMGATRAASPSLRARK